MIYKVSGNCQSFTSSIPARVFIDGLETFDEKLIKSSCRQLSNTLAGNRKNNLITEKFAKYVPDYNKNEASNANLRKNALPSDYMRCIINKNKTYLITGMHADLLKQTGKNIGLERAACKDRGVGYSFDLMVSKQNYGRVVSDLVNNMKIRLREVIDNRQGKPLTLNINMKSNRKYGLKTFKMNLEDINFSVS